MILLSIGSNQGDRLALLAQAAGLLAEKGIKILGASAVYETDPFGFLEQPPFLNAVLEVETTEAPEQLLASCLAVETALGRKRLVRWGPRTLDLDILYISGVHCSDEYLKLPHPGLFSKSFCIGAVMGTFERKATRRSCDGAGTLGRITGGCTRCALVCTVSFAADKNGIKADTM